MQKRVKYFLIRLHYLTVTSNHERLPWFPPLAIASRQVKGRKRHIVVDSQGLLIGVLVTEANGSERLGAVVILSEALEKLKLLEVVWVDLWLFRKEFCSSRQTGMW
ncbi:transposase [Moorena sp. SIO1F2]|uniref:transposase n=1 Tax=Moorena sp. SIO1F2 TaxID=2607819 RepID=UPI00345B964C